MERQWKRKSSDSSIICVAKVFTFMSVLGWILSVVVVVESFGMMTLPQPSGLSKSKLLEMAQRRYNSSSSSSSDIPMNGKVVVITGAAGGIGKELCQVLYHLGATVIALDQNTQGLDQLQQQIDNHRNNNQPKPQRLYTWEVHQDDLHSVSRVAKTIQSQFPTIDVLINNAGLAYKDPTSIDTTNAISAHGKDLAFTVNYLSHVLLTEILHPNLCETDDGRVVHITSSFHWKVDGSELCVSSLKDGDEPMAYQSDPSLQSPFHFQRSYANTKLAQLWHSQCISYCTSVCACPTWAATNIAGETGSGKDFLSSYAFPISNMGPGITSSINAILRTNDELGHALHNNNNKINNGCYFVANSKILEYIWGIDTWLTSPLFSDVRDTLADLCSLILLFGQRYTHDDLIIQKTSPETFEDREKIQKFYNWSIQEIQPYL